MTKNNFTEPVTLQLAIEGTTELLLHNVRLADALDPHTKKLKAITSNKQLEIDEKEEQKARAEFEGSLYWDDETGAYLPGFNILRSFMEGGTFAKKGTAISQAVLSYTQKCPIIYGRNCKTPTELYDGGYVHRAIVTVQRSKVSRTRPAFYPWAVAFSLTFDPSIISQDELMRAASMAGAYKGVGDGRTGGYGKGRYSVEKI